MGQEVSQDLAGPVGSSQDLFEIWVGSGRVGSGRRVSNFTGRVGTAWPDLTQPDPTPREMTRLVKIPETFQNGFENRRTLAGGGVRRLHSIPEQRFEHHSPFR